MVIKVGDKWCKATTTWKFWWNFLAKSIIFSRYPSFSPFERPDAYKCYTFSESYGSRETREIKILTSKFDLEARGILSSLWTQTGPWSDTVSYAQFQNHLQWHLKTMKLLEKNTYLAKNTRSSFCLIIVFVQRHQKSSTIYWLFARACVSCFKWWLATFYHKKPMS